MHKWISQYDGQHFKLGMTFVVIMRVRQLLLSFA
jgi:hypothetical protein